MFDKYKNQHFLTFYNRTESKLFKDYKHIKSNIEFAAYKNKYQTVSFISPTSGEGKTTTCCHLALTFAREGKNVLLIDGNLNHPMLNKIFHVKNDYGLSNVLVGQKKLSESINTTQFESLKLLTSGPTMANFNPILQSSAMDHLIGEVKEKFDFIFIDNPPVLDSDTGKIIASKSDGTVLVVRDHKTDINEMLEAKRVLDAYAVNLIGVIFNGKKLSIKDRLIRA
ncbi:CpsD/CapB family tyrosine-protein kinase [Salipaludibacillus neizhouensis]|uniref:CpsD/CapB family tyrosine-protein kinase n=1 Tax=Salipaludibacillus neizhouensis TaxID=885475 RepID=UPI00167D7FA2|nr:CpsD/CapB family tyrosine-protein kinase [Salipaludibacillus neizhouensis]